MRRKPSGSNANADFITIGAHDHVFVLTGAGVSAESGLATFRDSGGLWHGHRVEEVATPEAWHSNAEMVWQFYSMRRRNALAAQPNSAHLALARLEEQLGDRLFLCTQNVDDLHERAGSKRVVHMHGELFRSRCELCEAPPFHDKAVYERAEDIALCTCGARIRPHIVWFGEVPLEMPRIMHELDRCTVLIVVGTSGVVQPAASFVHWAALRYLNGGPMVHTYYVGPEQPANSSGFSRSFLGKAGELLPNLLSMTR